jgi:O-antigen/teichoic acid export membrane protein
VDRYPLVASARPDFSMVWPLLRFSLSVSAAKMLDNLSLQSDRFLIGRYLGAASLGLLDSPGR